MTALKELIDSLCRLPGVGPKTASRLAYHFINTDPQYNNILGEEISTIQEKIFTCSVCGSFTETDPCEVCSDELRDRTKLCIIEQPQDVITLTSSGAYDGLFHVLGGAINPIEGLGPEKLSFSKLLKRIDEGQFKEIIIATNPTEEGDTTALYLKHILKDKDLEITRLASGLPIGGDLEYADKTTVARSFRGRIKF